jgi:hypothetical protein
MTWETIEAPPGLVPPGPMTVRVQSIPARHYFLEHAHRWSQVVYAISGVLTVAVEGRSFVSSPEKAVWLPTGGLVQQDTETWGLEVEWGTDGALCFTDHNRAHAPVSCPEAPTKAQCGTAEAFTSGTLLQSETP